MIMSASKSRIVFIHTSSAAIGPLMQFYGEAAPELEITNLLDDGILRLFAAEQWAEAECRLAEMIETARVAYGVELAMLSCSAVPPAMLARLQRTSNLPVLKIDDALAQRAVRAGRRIGVVVTFAPALEPARQLLSRAAAEVGVPIGIVPEVCSEAYQALLAGDHHRHDALLIDAVRRLEGQKVDAVILAQVSMARILAQVEGRVATPVLSSLPSSLEAIRETLREQQ